MSVKCTTNLPCVRLKKIRLYIRLQNNFDLLDDQFDFMYTLHVSLRHKKVVMVFCNGFTFMLKVFDNV